jgi:hypothetical protein
VTDSTPSPSPEATSSPEALEGATPAPAPRYGWLSVAIAAFFGLFYAYDLWEAVSTFFELPTFYEAFGFDVAQLPWWVLVLMLVLPVVVFLLALWAGRRRTVGERALLLLVGLSVVAALSLGLIALEAILRPALLSGVLG